MRADAHPCLLAVSVCMPGVCFREETLAHMANYGMGGSDGRGADDLQQLVRNQQQNLQQDRRILGIDAVQGRKPQVGALCKGHMGLEMPRGEHCSAFCAS
jgi:hypothetical protein